ncbi:MAG: LysR family transcriptional regulator [Burkholderiaceae bacterium]
MDRLLSMRTFAEVVNQGGFAAAARSLELSPAVVTRLVGDLEAHLGTRLLQRTTRRVALTEAGDAYLARLRPILADLDEAEQLAQAQTVLMSGTIRIAATPSLALHLLAPLAAEFRIEHPQVTLDVHVEISAEAFVEDFDLTLLVADSTFDAAVVARRLIDADKLLCAAPRHLQWFGTPTAPAELSKHPAVTLKIPTMPVGGSWRIERIADAAIVEVAMQNAFVSNHVEVLLRAVLDGCGIGALPVHLVAPYIARGELVHVLPGWRTGHSVVYAALPSRKFLPARTRALLDFLLKHTQSLRDETPAPRV